MLSLVRSARPLAVLALALAAAAPASAQCIGPDGLDGPCCALATPNLPPFPPIAMPGSGLCWSACSLTGTRDVRIQASPPTPVSCAQFNAQLTVSDSTSGLPIASGLLVLDYTRTWREVDPTGIDHQVWRFAVKVDLSASTAAPIACPVPTCLPSQATAFFYGYADYALNCATGNFETVLVLFHNCDLFIHGPAHSSKAGVFHPGETYAIVGPDTPGNPFVPVISPRAGGPLVAEAMRTNLAPIGIAACQTEEPIVAGDLTPIIDLCGCPLSLSGAQLTISAYKGGGACGSSFAALDTLTYGLPWFHLLTTSLGCWSNDTSYPGKECAFVDEGVFGYHDACFAIPGATGNSIDILYGGSTSEGWAVPPTPIGLPLTRHFTDMASNFSASLPGPVVPPFTGTVLPTLHLVYTNVP